MSCAVLSYHGRERIKERIGVSKSRIERTAEQALENGVRRDEATGSMKRYMESLLAKNPTARNARIYCGNVYIFSGRNVLITAFPLPSRYRKIENKIRKNRANEMNEED